MKRLAVFFPGIGYTADKPLLHYSRRLAEKHGFEIRLLPYGGFPKKVKGDRERLLECCTLACRQAKEMLADLELDDYDDIVFVSKSIGTVAAAKLAAKSSARERIRFLFYTPLEETFDFPVERALVFTGSADPWVARDRIPALCREAGLPCVILPGANHSLETADPMADLRNMQKIMERTEAFLLRSASAEA